MQQNATNYASTVTIENYYQELTSGSGNTSAKSLSAFVSKTNSNGGYYFGRYEASQGTDRKAKSQYDKTAWVRITQPSAATNAQNMYSSNYVESDLINSYAWDTAIVFIQKYSGNTNYANQISINSSLLNTGISRDKVCNIYDMASNCMEWTTEYSTATGNSASGVRYPCVYRGGLCNSSHFTTSYRDNSQKVSAVKDLSFRLLCYLK